MKNTTEPLKVNPIQLIARFLFAFIFIKVLLQVLTSIFDLSYSLSAFQFLQILFIKIESKVYWITFLIQEVIDNITTYLFLPVLWFAGKFPVLIPVMNQGFLILYYCLRFLVLLINARYLLYLFPNINPYTQPWFVLEAGAKPIFDLMDFLFPKFFGIDVSLLAFLSILDAFSDFLLYSRLVQAN